MKSVVDDLKENKDLRPYFLDFLSRNIVLTMTDEFAVNSVDRIRIQKEYYISFHALAEQLYYIIPGEDIHTTVQEVCRTYIGKVGKISFDEYPLSSNL